MTLKVGETTTVRLKEPVILSGYGGEIGALTTSLTGPARYEVELVVTYRLQFQNLPNKAVLPDIVSAVSIDLMPLYDAGQTEFRVLEAPDEPIKRLGKIQTINIENPGRNIQQGPFRLHATGIFDLVAAEEEYAEIIAFAAQIAPTLPPDSVRIEINEASLALKRVV